MIAQSRRYTGSALSAAMTGGFVYTRVDNDTSGHSVDGKRENMTADRVMHNIRQAFERSEMTLTELGECLGYSGPTARKRAWFLLHRTPDPRISTVLAVAQALGVKTGDLAK